MFKRIRIRKYEVGLFFKEDAFDGILTEGTHKYFDPFGKIRVEIVSKKDANLKHERIEELVLSKKLGNNCLTCELNADQCAFEWIDGNLTRILPPGFHAWWTDYHKVQVDVQDRRAPWIVHAKLQQIVKSGLLGDAATVLDLQDHQRGLVWIDGRFTQVLAPGIHAFWNGLRDVRVEIVDVGSVRFEHQHFATIIAALGTSARSEFDVCTVNRYHVGVLFYDGKYIETLPPGIYAFWRKTKVALVTEVDLRELLFDISGQEIMTADQVSLRLNAGVSYRIIDAPKCLASVTDAQQAIYKEVQLILRAVVGTRELDVFLTDKDSVAQETAGKLRERIADWGIELISIGIRDIILPGEMKNLLNKVTEAKKAAEANLVVRREETAAMRSQANTAKILEGNPTLMRLRELEVIEKIAESGKLNLVIGEKGISEKIVNLL
jgi:regulator of protease activity HflC (stomatin/prohibitin superfamily)